MQSLSNNNILNFYCVIKFFLYMCEWMYRLLCFLSSSLNKKTKKTQVCSLFVHCTTLLLLTLNWGDIFVGGKDPHPSHPTNWVDKTCLAYLASKITIVKAKKWRENKKRKWPNKGNFEHSWVNLLVSQHICLELPPTQLWRCVLNLIAKWIKKIYLQFKFVFKDSKENYAILNHLKIQ
jgi:hypothetical protein